MAELLYPPSSRELAEERRALSPAIDNAFEDFSPQVFADGALPLKIERLIAVAAAHFTQCPYRIRGNTKAALRQHRELMDAIWVAAEMRAGGAYAHSAISLTTMDELAGGHSS